jgi:HTH-type transcriptional regulator, sugar sensing transcriptional regulator
MIVQTNFLNKLKDFGLNTYEAKLWTALLSRGVSTAGELSDIANVPRSRSYDVLESLEKKGFIVMKLGKPIKYIAVPPEEVINRVKKQVVDEADKHVESLKELKSSNVLTELNLLYNQGINLVDPTELSGSIKGRNNIYNQMESMIKNAEKSVILVTSTQGLVRKHVELKNALNAAKRKNIDIKIASPLTKETADIVKDLSNSAEVRHTENLTSRFLIIDNKELLFMLLDDKDVHSSYDVGIWLNSPFWTNTISNMFKNEWKLMKPLQQVLKKVA